MRSGKQYFFPMGLPPKYLVCACMCVGDFQNAVAKVFGVIASQLFHHLFQFNVAAMPILRVSTPTTPDSCLTNGTAYILFSGFRICNQVNACNRRQSTVPFGKLLSYDNVQLVFRETNRFESRKMCNRQPRRPKFCNLNRAGPFFCFQVGLSAPPFKVNHQPTIEFLAFITFHKWIAKPTIHFFWRSRSVDASKKP